jgi:tetratricopeptide (TPR) repeat protein
MAEGDRFCGSCGLELKGGAAAPPSGPVAATLNAEGLALLAQGRHAQARERFDRALDLDPGNADVLSNRGLTLHRLGRQRVALDDYRRAIELAPDAPEPHHNRGALHLEQRRFDDALADLNRALRLDPDYTHAYHARGLLHLARGERSAARADFEAAAALDGPLQAQAIEQLQRLDSKRGGRRFPWGWVLVVILFAGLGFARYRDGALLRDLVEWVRALLGL